MKLKSISIHAIALFTWIMAVVIYIYSQNNIYSCVLVLALLTFLSVYYIRLSWKGLLYSWSLVSLGMMLFYGLFLHQGNQVWFEIPGNFPLLSGVVSWNAILYGFFLGGSLVLSLFMFSIFSSFLRDQRPRFYFAGLGANLSILFSFLSYFVSFFLEHVEVFDQKIKNRGISPSLLQRAKLFMQDASFHALENAFVFAETLEMRGFSLHQRKTNFYDWMTIVLSFNTVLFLFLYRVQHQVWQLIAIIFSLFGIALLLRQIKQKSLVSRKYDYSFRWNDWIVMVWSLLFLVYGLMETVGAQNFLSKDELHQYFLFDWKMHVAFIVHIAFAFCFFGLRKNSP